MIAARLSMLAVALAPCLGGAQSTAATRTQPLSDPMQPPAFAGAASATTGERASAAEVGLVLQSTILSRGRRIAMIGGRSMHVGDRIGEARIVAIDADSVTLREGAATRVLKLYEGVEISSGMAAKAPASGEGTPHGRKEATK